MSEAMEEIKQRPVSQKNPQEQRLAESLVTLERDASAALHLMDTRRTHLIELAVCCALFCSSPVAESD